MLKTSEADDMRGSLKRKHHPGNGGGGLDDFCDHATPIDPSLSDVAHNGSGTPTGFTAVNESHEEGRSLLASNANDDGGGSNGLVSEQAHITKNSLSQARSDPVYRDGRDTGTKVTAAMLPSSNAIITGAVPSSRAGISGGSVHGAMGTPSSSSSSYFNQTYPASSVWDGNLHSGAITSSNPFNINPSRNLTENNASGTMPLTSLEENPLAFIAAAGLLQSDSLSTQRSATTTGEKPAGVQPQLLRNTSPLAPSPASTAIMTPPQKAPPRHKGSKLKPDLPFIPPLLPPERESVVGDWVRKTKVASRWAKTLKKNSRLVILRPPIVRFKELVEEIMEKDKVASDLVLVAPGLYAPVPRSIPSVCPEKRPLSGPTVKRKRGRPRKSETVEVSEDNGSDCDDEITNVNMEIQRSKAKERRQSAYLRRKKEEEEAKVAFLESQARRNTTGGISVTSIKRRNRVKNADVLAMLQTQLPGDASLPLNQPTKDAEDTFSPAAFTGSSLIEETEEEKAAHQKWEEERHALTASVAQEARIRQEEEAAKCAAAAIERRAEEKVARKAQRARLLVEEKERCRREADRKAKLVAAGVLDESEFEEYISSLEPEFSSPESEASELEGEAPEEPEQLSLPAETFDTPLQIDEFNSGDVAALIPLSWSFAVVVEQPSIRNWRKFYGPDPSLPLRPAKRRPGRPRKHPLPIAIAPTPSSKTTAIAKRRKPAADTNFRAGWVVGESGAAVGVEMKERERKWTAGEGVRHNVDLEDEEEWGDRGEKVVKREKKKASRKVEIVPKRWAEMEIIESEDEGDEDVQVSGGEELEATGERGIAEEVPVREGGKDVEMEVGDEYERRWNNRKRSGWF
jgi:hypothetical protein